jgi:hypothetical protein
MRRAASAACSIVISVVSSNARRARRHRGGVAAAVAGVALADIGQHVLVGHRPRPGRQLLPAALGAHLGVAVT